MSELVPVEPVIEGELAIENPYWDIVKEIPGDDIALRYDNRWEPQSYPRLRGYADGKFPSAAEVEAMPSRDDLVTLYSWAISSPDSVAFVLEHLDGRPVVEVGAGTGYWLWLLQQSGIDVAAYDEHPPGEGWNWYHCPREMVMHTYTDEERRKDRERHDQLADATSLLAGAIALHDPDATPFPKPEYRELPPAEMRKRVNGTPGNEWVPIRKGGVEVLAEPDNQTRVLFLCWPPYDDDFGVQAVEAYRGDTIIYIGESEGGCCGNDAMFEALDRDFEEVAWCQDHVNWWAIHDRLIVFRRKS